MDSESTTLLNIPITEEERISSQQTRPSTSSTQANSIKSFAQHARDRQFTPELGRFASLRQPGERYDDPDQHSRLGHSRSTTLPDIEEEYSIHEDDDEPLNRPRRTSTFARTDPEGYQPVRYQTQAARDQETPVNQFWQPTWLRRRFLGAVALLTLLLMAALITTCQRAEVNHGYAVPNQMWHCLWTWIPILLFVLLSGVHHQIDVYSKLLTPWKALSLGPVSPSESILADYFSPYQIVSFIAAFKHSHQPVIITTTTLIISKGLVIAGTALFIIQSRSFTETFSTIYTSSFGVSPFNENIDAIESAANTSIYFYLQNLTNNLGSQVGFTGEFAYLTPQFAKPELLPSNSTFTIQTEVFLPNINCRAASVTLQGEADISTVEFPFNSTDHPYGSPSNITLRVDEPSLCSFWPEQLFIGLDPLHYLVPEKQIESRIEHLDCGDSGTSGIVLLSLIEISYEQRLLTNVTRKEGGDLPIALNTSRSVSRMQHVLCTADYSSGQVNLTNDTSIYGAAALSLSNLTSSEGRISGLSSSNLTCLFKNLLNRDSGYFPSTSVSTLIRSPGFDVMAFAHNGSYEPLFDGSRLTQTAEGVSMGIMPHFVSRNFVIPGNRRDGPVASVFWSQERLLPNWTAVIVALIGLGSSAVLTCLLIMIAPRNVVPRDPRSISAAATTLARSPELNRLLQKLKVLSNTEISNILNGHEVATAIAVDQTDGSRSFKIHVTEDRQQRRATTAEYDVKFWNPVWASFPIAVLTMALPLVLITALELLQHFSDLRGGLFDVPDDKGSVIGSHYIPAFLTLIVAATIGNLTFYFTLYAPWSNMAGKRVVAKHSIYTNVFGHSTLSAIKNSVKCGYWAVLLAVLATFFATLLTVFVSGLFIVIDFRYPGPTQSLSQLDDFSANLATRYTVDFDGGAGSMMELIQSNITFPAFTMDEYAFPRLRFLGQRSDMNQESELVGPMQITLPAWRGDLSCDEPGEVDLIKGNSKMRLKTSYKVSDSCLRGSRSELDNATIRISLDFDESQSVGQLFDLRFGTNSSQYGHLGETDSSMVGDNPSAGCPSLVFVWGNPQDKTPMNIAVCYQKLQAITVNATMQQNTTNLDTGQPIIPDETTTRSILDPNGTDIFNFRVQNNLLRHLAPSTQPNIDPFFALIDNFHSSNRSAALHLITHTYRVYMAQAINSLFRENLSLKSRQQTTIPDVHTTILKPRLVQDKPSKFILQILLALSSICITIAYFLCKIRNILPVNPCSIAGQMSLLAGSDLCHSSSSGICECCGKPKENIGIEVEDHERGRIIPIGTEWKTNKAFEKVFAGKMFSLSWWQTKDTRRYGVDFIDGEEWYLKRRTSETFEMFEETAERGRRDERGRYQRARISPGESLEMDRMDDEGDLGRLKPSGR